MYVLCCWWKVGVEKGWRATTEQMPAAVDDEMSEEEKKAFKVGAGNHNRR